MATATVRAWPLHQVTAGATNEVAHLFYTFLSDLYSDSEVIGYMAPFWWFPHQIVVGEASWFRYRPKFG